MEGELQEAACRVEMDSAFQQVDLGVISTDDLRQPGARSTPVPFHIYLRDCLRTRSAVRNVNTGNLSWSANQPVVSVAFMATADADEPTLVHPDSMTLSGVGLRLLSDSQETLTLGRRGRPKFLDPGQNTLTFYVVPERTLSPLAPGDFRATVSFSLDYE
ncbi:fimbrial protein [Dryocola sp. LX212]